MTMMALTRKKHRGLHLWALAVGLLVVAVVAVGVRGQQAAAIAEGDVQFSVSQSPAGGSIVQVGSTVTFNVAATVSVAPVALPVHFEFDYPAGLSYIPGGGSTPPGVTCVDNTPGPGKLRCSYGLVGTGPRLPVSFSFYVLASTTTTAAQVTVVAGDSDGGPDTAEDASDDSFTTAGTLTVFNSGNFTTAGSGAVSTLFEGTSSTYTATITNNSGVSTGAFNASLALTNAVVNGASCTTAGSNGTAGTSSGTTAACAGSILANGETLTITATYVASNSSGGSDISAQISAAGLGISQAGSPVTVDELGLDFTGVTLAAGTPITVCTALVPSDVANDAAAGAAQPGSISLVGTVSQTTLLNLSDFQVTGTLSGSPSTAAGCGSLQSGVTFTPSSGGSYSVTALYNVGGTNTLSLNVSGGAANNPVPSASLLSPSTANAGSGGFTLTVSGSNFVPASEVRWNGALRTTTFISANTLEAAISGADIASAGSANVTVFNPPPGGGTSNILAFTISAAPNPIPTISGISPNTVGAGSAQFLMTVTGTNFVAGSVVRWDDGSVTSLATTFSSSNSLTATVPAARVATAGAANITVFNPAPGGGITVTPQSFTITPGATKLAFTTQPGAGVAGSALAAQPVVAVQTAANATVTGDSATVVTLALNGTGTLTCTGGLTKTVSAGVATFSGCAVNVAGQDFTITASATSLTSANSATFDVSAAPPTSSPQVTVTNPTNSAIPRSRLTLSIATGNLAGTAVDFIIKRKSDNKYWNEAGGIWQTDLVLNEATHGTGNAWSLAIAGEDRRDFAGTTITLEARVTVGTTVYVNVTIPELNIR